MWIQNLEPLFFFESADNVQRIIFVRQVFDFVPNRPIGDVLDVVVFFSRVVALLGALLECPVEACRKARGSNQPRGIFHESIIVQHTNHLRFKIRRTVKGIHQQAARSRIERESHRVDGEIAPPQIFDDGRRSDDRRLASLLVALGAGHAYLGTHIAGKNEIKSLAVIVRGRDHCARALQILLQLQRIALHGEIQIANGKAADDVADGAARKIDIHARGTGNVLHQRDAALLVRRQPDLHGEDVISHSWFARTGPGSLEPPLFRRFPQGQRRDLPDRRQP